MSNVEDFKNNLITCLDCFGGADGGISFVNFRNGMEGLATKADHGDEDAKKLCDMFSHTAKLIKVFNG